MSTKPVPLAELEAKAREIAQRIGAACPEGVGFALMLFNFGADGNMTWISNANRDDMVEAMRELVARLGPPTPRPRRMFRVIRRGGP